MTILRYGRKGSRTRILKVKFEDKDTAKTLIKSPEARLHLPKRTYIRRDMMPAELEQEKELNTQCRKRNEEIKLYKMQPWFISCLIIAVFAQDKLKIYEINLDLEPEERWLQVAEDFKPHIPELNSLINSFFKFPFATILCWLSEKLSYSFPDEYRRELKGMADASGIEYCHLVGINVFHDIVNYNNEIDDHLGALNGCTSTIAVNKDGHLFHGRNFDYFHTDLIKKIMFIAEFKRNNEIVFTGLTLAYSTGFMTGQRPNKFALSLNARRAGWYIFNILMEIYTGFKTPTPFLLRQVLEQSTSYNDALDFLTKSHFLTPAYITLSGVKSDEGVLITRGRWKPENIVRLGEYKKAEWFIVETNYDHWQPDEDSRRTTAENALLKIGKDGIDENTVMEVLLIPPVTNNYTITTTIMSAAQPDLFYSTTFIRV